MHLRSNPPQKVVKLVLIILSSAMPWLTFEEHGENNEQPPSQDDHRDPPGKSTPQKVAGLSFLVLV